MKNAKSTKPIARRFTKEETVLYSEVLADPDNQFLGSLEKTNLGMERQPTKQFFFRTYFVNDVHLNHALLYREVNVSSA